MYKVLFVASARKGNISIIVKRQFESLRNLNIPVEVFPVNGKGIFGYLLYVVKLRSYLKKNKVNIIHAHYGLCGIISLIARKNEKLVVSFMGDDLLGSHNFKGKITLMSRLFASLNIFLAKRFYEHSILKSREMMNGFQTDDKLSIIPNGVDLDIFNQLPEKSLKSLKRSPDFNSQIAHVSFLSNPERPEKNYELIKKALQFIPIKHQIHTYHSCAENELVEIYNLTDVVALTSFHEGSPNIIKEAMACNCPIVSTDVGDVKWVLGDTEGCYLASFEPEDFAKKINLAIDFAKKNKRTKGRVRIAELGLDAGTVAGKIIEIYNKVLN